MAPSVVGTNEGGAPVIDLGVLTGMGAQMQGGGAAIPPTAEVEAARRAAEAAVAEFDRARTRLSRAWTGASSSESEGGSSEEESEEGNTVDSPDEDVDLEQESELQEAMDAEATGANLMDSANATKGARLLLVGHGTAGGGHGDGLLVAWGGLHGYYNYFECNGTLWLPRSVSFAEEGDPAHEGVRATMGDVAAGIAWGKHMAYAYFRRMQRLLGRQFASEHKARRKKYIGTWGPRGAREGSVVGSWGTNDGVRTAVVGAVTLASFGMRGLLLRSVLGIYSNFGLRHGVNTPGGVAASGAVTCNSEVRLLQQRSVTGNVTLGRVDSVAGNRDSGRGGDLEATCVDWRWLGGGTLDGDGPVGGAACEDDAAGQGPLVDGGTGDAITLDCSAEQDPCIETHWIAG